MQKFKIIVKPLLGEKYMEGKKERKKERKKKEGIMPSLVATTSVYFEGFPCEIHFQVHLSTTSCGSTVGYMPACGPG